MENTTLLSEYISEDINAKNLVVFGGSEYRRDEIIRLLMPLGLNIFGTLSEKEGIEKLNNLPNASFVLIGGRYTDNERVRIREFVKHNLPNAKITEPGYHYPYSNEAIFENIKQLL
jgi:hypothetical protein